jgi:hypothetical protein
MLRRGSETSAVIDEHVLDAVAQSALPLDGAIETYEKRISLGAFRTPRAPPADHEELAVGHRLYEHATHLTERCPEITKYVDLPAGSRFLTAPGYEDVWTDEALLDV